MNALQPLSSESLKEKCIFKLEELIFSGYFAPGQRLPAERDLARQLGISRPVVHEAIVELASMGLVTLQPRKGTVVNEFRAEGTLALVTSMARHGSADEHGKLVSDMLHLRLLFEVDAARLAALKRSDRDCEAMKEICRERERVPEDQASLQAQIDFRFHQAVMIATDNYLYPLLLNSFRDFHLDLAEKFYRQRGVLAFVREKHCDLIGAIERGAPDLAAQIMKDLIGHGEKHLLSTKEEGNHE
jgi:DNA-binding FadR family transcriptional regulator